MVVAVAPIVMAGVTVELTVIITVLDVAVTGVAQAAVEVITQLTASPFTSAAFEYAALLVPTLPPFSFHWYDGAPPLTGVAVKVTFCPAQILVALAAIVTAGTTTGSTVMVTGFEVAVVGEAQAAFEVITQVTTSPLARDEFGYAALLVPTFPPFSFH